MVIYTIKDPSHAYAIGKDTPLVWASFITLLVSLTVTLIWVPLEGQSLFTIALDTSSPPFLRPAPSQARINVKLSHVPLSSLLPPRLHCRLAHDAPHRALPAGVVCALPRHGAGSGPNGS